MEKSIFVKCVGLTPKRLGGYNGQGKNHGSQEGKQQGLVR
jgi:hypothetical protein